MIKNVKYRVLGVMSGTSLDGVDLAICSFSKTTSWSFKIEKCETIKYPDYWIKTLSELPKNKKKVILKNNIEYGKYLAEIITKFLQNEKVEFIASHGHTIFHQPEKNYTLQIGCGKTIANITKTTVINNFRNLDVSLNGQGAPLVPIGDLNLFYDYKYCVNLGGFANISIKKDQKITAFDICPANIVMNELSQKIGRAYDKNGDLARSGKLIPKLLAELNNLLFYKKSGPKSLAKEWVEEKIMPLLESTYKPIDILHTFSNHIALQIGKHLIEESAFFTGGGVFNKYLMELIAQNSKAKIIKPSTRIINFKEALIFAYLGVLKIRNEVNCLKSVTGSAMDNCGGEIHNPFVEKTKI